MKVTLTDRENKFNVRDRVEDKPGLSKVYIVLDNKVKKILECRVYWKTGFNTCTACLWVYNDIYTNGSGNANGSGYHKPSKAVAYAIDNAGIDLDDDIGGRGDSAIREALTAIAMEVSGKKTIHLIETHA
jgi:hypothetical protein